MQSKSLLAFKITLFINSLFLFLSVLFSSLFSSKLTFYDYLQTDNFTLSLAVLLLVSTLIVMVRVLQKIKVPQVNMAGVGWLFVLNNTILVPFYFGRNSNLTWLVLTIMLVSMVVAVVISIFARLKFKHLKPQPFRAEKGEKKLYQAICMSFLGFNGTITLTNKRIFVSGQNIVTGKITNASIPYQNIIELVPPGKILAHILKLKYEGGKLNFAVLGQADNMKKNRQEFKAVFNFIKKMKNDPNFRKKVDTNYPTLNNQTLQEDYEQDMHHYIIYLIAMGVALAARNLLVSVILFIIAYYLGLYLQKRYAA